MRYFIANWKSHKRIEEVRSWLEVFEGIGFDDGVISVLCPASVFLERVRTIVDDKSLGFHLGVQDVSPFPMGSYTGAVAVEMIEDWIEYAIVGHSERRRYFHETNQEIANKVDRCLENNVVPILCVDAPYAEAQFAAIEEGKVKKCVVAYEPLDAIGTGTPDKPENAKGVIDRMRGMLPEGVPVIYGGSVTSSNVSDYVNDDIAEGVLVGGASLDAGEWRSIIDNA